MYGEQSEQIWITGDLQRVSQYFADPVKVIQALKQRNIIESSGHFEADRTKIPFAPPAFSIRKKRSETCSWTSPARASLSISAILPKLSGDTRTRRCRAL